MTQSDIYDCGFGGTHACILGLVVLYGIYAFLVPDIFSVWSTIHGYFGRFGSCNRNVAKYT